MRNWLDLDQNSADRFGDHEVACKHRFAESGLFTDEKIAELIERYPRAHYNVNTMNRQGEKRFWRDGEIGDLSGLEVLNAIRNGHIWLSLHHIEDNAPEIGSMIQGAFNQVKTMKPGYKSWRHNTSLLISSPGAKVHCHADVPMIALWHLRGRKQVWLWDPEDKSVLPNKTMEGIILREHEEDALAYRPDWDDKANSYVLEPGDAVSWPLNAPHRVDNLDGLNMSLTTEYMNPEAQRKYGVYYANGFLRRAIGMEPRSTAIEGPAALAKCAFALAIKKLGIRKTEKFEFVSTFKVDPDAPDGVRLLKPDECKVIDLA